MKSSYVLVNWPDSQEYMEESWFGDEAILALGSEEKTGSSAYFIPLQRYIETLPVKDRIKHQVIRDFVEDLSRLYPITPEDVRNNQYEWGLSIPFEGGMSTEESIVDIRLKLKDDGEETI